MMSEELDTWEPFGISDYDGGYIVRRKDDGCKMAVFVCESEALFVVDAINAECRRKGHTGFGLDED